MKKIISALCISALLCSVLAGCAVYEKSCIPEGANNLALGAAARLLISEEKTKDYSKAVDGKAGTGTNTQLNKGTIEIDFGKEQTFNTVVLREIGWNIRDFHIEVQTSNDEKFETVYSADRIETVRYCAIEKPITAKKLRIVIDKSNEPFTLGEIEVYNQNATTSRNDFAVVGYVVTDGMFNESFYDKDDSYYLDKEYFNAFTELNVLGWMQLCGDGTIKISKPNYESSNNKETVVISAEEMGSYVSELRRHIGNEKVQLTATLNNSNHDEMYSAVKEHKDENIKNTIDFLLKTGFDGISFDWERPQSQEQFDAFSDYIIDLKAELVKVNKRLTLAWAPWGVDMKPEAVKAADAIEIMTYDLFDQYGNQASFTESTVQTIKYFTDLGYDKKQLHIGLPYYARPSDGGEFWPVYDDENYRLSKSSDADSDYLSDKGLSYFNSCQTVADKTAFALCEGIGGIMAFRLELDRPYSDDICLTKAIENVLNNRTKQEAQDNEQ